jgi:uncharacterized protein YdeI (BOF family)
VIHGTFADTWRITQDESRFTYGSGQSTETFTDRTFPSSIVSVGDLSDSVLADATSRCEDAGVVDGTQFEDCVIDWALTQDAQFVSVAAAPITPAMEGGARTVDANGVVAESFNGAVAPNFSAARYGAGPAAGAFAGPFGRDGRYVFYVPAIAAHSSGTVEFDLVAIGDWATNASSNTVSLQVDGVTVWTGAVATGTPSSTGTLSTGQAYAVHPVSVNLAHTGTQLYAGITAPIPIGSNRVFGIDNVEASFTLVPPQFDVTLPLAASNGVPSAGAGNLETAASEDVYRFTAGAGDLQIDVASCSSSLGYYVEWDLLKEQNGEVVASEAGCAGTLIPNVPAGQYRLSVNRNGASGTYSIGAYTAPAPQTFNVTLPETTSSQDVYAFTTSSDGKVQVDLSSCSSSLGYYVDWKLVDTNSGATVYSTSGCGSELVPNVPAGQYRLVVTRNGRSGTYAVSISLQPAPQIFDVALPVSISNGVPAAGAGNLETTSSEDVYRFTTTAAGGIQIDVSNCAGSLGYYVTWSLINEQTGAVLHSTSGCASVLVQNVPAASLRLSVTRNGNSGTYSLGILVQPPPQSFDVAPPVTISNGVPAAGAGNLETTSSEDRYVFSTSAAGGVQFDFSDCAGSLGYYVDWKLVDNQSGSTVYSTSACASKLVPNVPAGEYRLVVTRNGSSGTYKVGILVQPAPQSFDVSLSVSISNGVPAAGAGNLETTASEDVYRFTTTATGTLQLAFGGCGGSLGYYVSYTLVNEQSGATVSSASTCSTRTVSALAAGQYKVVVNRNGGTGTYTLGISLGA